MQLIVDNTKESLGWHQNSLSKNKKIEYDYHSFKQAVKSIDFSHVTHFPTSRVATANVPATRELSLLELVGICSIGFSGAAIIVNLLGWGV